jgi:hypothetical protein
MSPRQHQPSADVVAAIADWRGISVSSVIEVVPHSQQPERL